MHRSDHLMIFLLPSFGPTDGAGGHVRGAGGPGLTWPPPVSFFGRLKTILAVTGLMLHGSNSGEQVLLHCCFMFIVWVGLPECFNAAPACPAEYGDMHYV